MEYNQGMDTQPQPSPLGPSPSTGEATPAPAHSGRLVYVVGGLIALAVVAAGAYFLIYGVPPTVPYQPQQEQGAPQGGNSVDSIEADLNAQSDVDSSQDLDSLQQSL